MNNTKRKIKKNQALFKVFSLSEEFSVNPESFIQEMSQPERKAFNILLAFSKKNGESFSISNALMATYMGCTPFSVQRWKREWIKNGLLESTTQFKHIAINRRRQIESLYRFSPYFKLPFVESLLGHLLPALKLLTLSLLTVSLMSISMDKIDKGKLVAVNSKYRDIRNLCINKATSAWRIVESNKKQGLLMGEKAMITFDDVVPIHIRDISELKLTQSGMIRLSGYSTSAIQYARRAIVRTNKFIENPFAYFVALCDQYCRDTNTIPDWKLVELMKKVFGWQADQPMLKSSLVNKKGTRKPSSTVTHPPKKQEIQNSLKREQRINNLPAPCFISPVRPSHHPVEEKYIPKAPKEFDVNAFLSRHKQYDTKPQHTPESLALLNAWGIDPHNFERIPS